MELGYVNATLSNNESSWSAVRRTVSIRSIVINNSNYRGQKTLRRRKMFLEQYAFPTRRDWRRRLTVVGNRAAGGVSQSIAVEI